MARKKAEAVIPDRDELADLLKDALNKEFKKKGQAAYYLDGGEDTPVDLDSWVSTGCVSLDLAISNRPNAGLAAGRIVELTGMEQSGKSLLAASILRETQKKGGLAIFIDTEAAQTSDWLVALGVDVSKMLYIQAETIEDCFTALVTVIDRAREKGKDRLITIVVDSVAGASTSSEISSKFERTGYNTDKAIIMSESMRKITNLIAREKILLLFTNQLRMNMNATAFGEKYTSPGGKALAFHASVRLRLAKISTIKKEVNGMKKAVGIQTKVKIVKNRLGPPLGEVTYDVYFDRGIDNISSIINLAKPLKVIKGTGAYKKWVNVETGEEVSFLNNDDFVEKIWDVEENRNVFYQDLCDAYITTYKTDSNDVEGLEVDSTDE